MKVLALGHTYEPIGILPWQKAVNLIFSGKVYCLSEYAEKINSPTFSMNVPSVIVFKSGKRTKVNSARFSRKNVWVRDEGKCQYCGVKVSPDDYTLDHVIPKKRGGSTSWLNVVTCCYSCNQRKGDKPLDQTGMKLLKPVIKPSSLPYFQDMQFYAATSTIPEDWKYWLGQNV